MDVVVIGYGGHAFVAVEMLLMQGYNVIGYCDVRQQKNNPFDLDYLGSEDNYFNSISDKTNIAAFIAIGKMEIRKRVHHQLANLSIGLVNAVHPKAVVSQQVILGKGIFIAANASINPLSNIGDGVICNTSSSVDHECSVGDFSHICPGTVLCGNVTVGKNCLIGANSTIIPGIKIGDNVIVGAGSTVISDIIEEGVYAGSPAKRIN